MNVLSGKGIDYEPPFSNVNTCSRPSKLRITDLRLAEVGPYILLKLYTNQGLVGYGEVRDAASGTYALMLKSRILGENPCDVDRIFRRIKQFGAHGRQAGGVCGVEVALWDLAGKAYGVPVYQLLGGRFRDRIRLYCDTDASGKSDGASMGQALKQRMEAGFTFLKMDMGISLLYDEPGALSMPAGLLEENNAYRRQSGRRGKMSLEQRYHRNRWYEYQNLAHPFTGIHLTEKGLDILEEYVADVRSIIGYEVPLAIDHFGHIGIEDCIKLARRLDKYALAWLEDMVPWQYTDQYVRLAHSCTTPICTGEDIYLKENFRPLLESRGVGVVHPDILTSGGILENKKIGDLAGEYGVAMAIHMAESPVAALAAAHSATATENFLALEFHAMDCDWWEDLVIGPDKPIVNNGFITVSDAPGLGIESLNEEVVAEHRRPGALQPWAPTDGWDDDWSHDRVWS